MCNIRVECYHNVQDESNDFIILVYKMITVIRLTANSSDNSNHINDDYVVGDNNLRTFRQYIVLLKYLYACQSIILTILQDYRVWCV
jgi:hypothetical protein